TVGCDKVGTRAQRSRPESTLSELRSRAMGIPRTGVGLPASLLVSLTLISMLAAPGGARAQAQTQSTAAPGVYWVYVGTYTGGTQPDRSRGIYVMELDTRTGELGPPRVAAASPDPSFLAIHPNREFLYAVNESGGILGQRKGGVSAFAVRRGPGARALVDPQLS